MKQQTIGIIVLVAIVSAGGGFFAGTKYQQSKRGQFIAQMGNGTFRMGTSGTMRGNSTRGNMRPVAGEIIKSDDSSITVKMTDGSSRIVLVSSNTAINKAAQGSKSDLSQGTQVVVFGTENMDGSVTATNIQLNPIRMEITGAPTK